MNPYIDVSSSEKGEPEYSIHKLNKEQIITILNSLVLISAVKSISSESTNKKDSLVTDLTASFNSIVS